MPHLQQMRTSMGPRIRLVLPLLQVALAVALTARNALRPDTLSNPSWTAPDRQFCDGLNAPCSLIRFCFTTIMNRWLPGHYRLESVLSAIVYFVLVWLVWYAVSIEIGGEGCSLLAPRTGIRSVADVAAMIFGAALVATGLLVRRQFGPVTTYSNLVAMPYFVWGATVAVFYAHDLRACLGTAQKESAGEDHAR
jgi:hypothetical protein